MGKSNKQNIYIYNSHTGKPERLSSNCLKSDHVILSTRVLHLQDVRLVKKNIFLGIRTSESLYNNKYLECQVVKTEHLRRRMSAYLKYKSPTVKGRCQR